MQVHFISWRRGSLLGIEVSSIAATNIHVMSDTGVGPRPWVYPPTAKHPCTSILQHYIGNLLSNTYNNMSYCIFYCYSSFGGIENCATVYRDKLRTRRCCVDSEQRLFGHASDATVTKVTLGENIIDRKTISLGILSSGNTVKWYGGATWPIWVPFPWTRERLFLFLPRVSVTSWHPGILSSFGLPFLESCMIWIYTV